MTALEDVAVDLTGGKVAHSGCLKRACRVGRGSSRAGPAGTPYADSQGQRTVSKKKNSLAALKAANQDAEEQDRLVAQILEQGQAIAALFMVFRLRSQGLLLVADVVKEMGVKYAKVRVAAKQQELLAAARTYGEKSDACFDDRRVERRISL